MAVELNHTIVACPDKTEAATWLAELLGLPAPKPLGPFMAVELANNMTLDFASTDEGIHPQHYAFLISEPEFDQVFGRITERGMDFWADPMQNQPGEINKRGGGRGCYFVGPGGHFLEILTPFVDGG